MTRPDLKPCPFCGGSAWVRSWPIIGGDLFKAMCDNIHCGAETAAESSPEAAAKRWNQRTKPTTNGKETK